MDFEKYEQKDGYIVVYGVKNFCLDDILSCGQCFRWDKTDDGDWSGTVRGLCRKASQKDGDLYIYGADLTEFEQIWYQYFDFCTDYENVKGILSQDRTMAKAIEFTGGMRVLRQEPWEALCSFILSQNNNIKRIKGIISRLCENFGEKIDGGFAFPGFNAIARLEAWQLEPVRSGFRAGYVIDAAKKVSSGEVDLEGIRDMSIEQASNELCKIKGVGPKVAACALLYGFARTDIVPVDVWIKRAIDEYYPNGIPDGIKQVSGLGQQYLFHYMRNRQRDIELLNI